MLQVEMRRTLLNQVKCLKFKVPKVPKVPKVRGAKMAVFTRFGLVFTPRLSFDRINTSDRFSYIFS